MNVDIQNDLTIMDIKNMRLVIDCRFVCERMPTDQRPKWATDEELDFIQVAIEEKIERDKMNEK